MYKPSNIMNMVVAHCQLGTSEEYAGIRANGAANDNIYQDTRTKTCKSENAKTTLKAADLHKVKKVKNWSLTGIKSDIEETRRYGGRGRKNASFYSQTQVKFDAKSNS